MSKFQKSGHRGKHNRRNDRDRVTNIGEQGKEVLENIDENSEILQQFKGFAQELDAKHDKHERLVKISRDITIESKRIIFLLHSLDRSSKQDAVFAEADSRISDIISKYFMLIARELEGMDPFQFHRAYLPGFQEFIEAITFYHYLKDKQFYHWKEYEAKFTYTISNTPVKNELATPADTEDVVTTRIISVHLPPIDFILGIADLTGELMRKCINSLGAGDIKECFDTCDVVRQIFSGFLKIQNSRDISSKVYTLRQSLLKMENVCYNIHVRGTEVPKHVLTDVMIPDAYEEEDEGYYN